MNQKYCHILVFPWKQKPRWCGGCRMWKEERELGWEKGRSSPKAVSQRLIQTSEDIWSACCLLELPHICYKRIHSRSHWLQPPWPPGESWGSSEAILCSWFTSSAAASWKMFGESPHHSLAPNPPLEEGRDTVYQSCSIGISSMKMYSISLITIITQRGISYKLDIQLKDSSKLLQSKWN